MQRYLLPLALIATAAVRLPAQEYVWLEGESPTKATVQFEPGGWGHAEYLSGGSWLHGSVEPKDLEAKIPAEGAILSYGFEAKAAGDYEAWTRIGYEFVRSPFSWRLDDGAWKESKSEDLTTDLMALQAWNEVAWLKLGAVPLKPGKHTFEIKFDRQYKVNNGKKEPDRILFGLDAICLYQGAFRPNGPFKPDEKETKDIDKTAAAQVFSVQARVGGVLGKDSPGTVRGRSSALMGRHWLRHCATWRKGWRNRSRWCVRVIRGCAIAPNFWAPRKPLRPFPSDRSARNGSGCYGRRWDQGTPEHDAPRRGGDAARRVYRAAAASGQGKGRGNIWSVNADWCNRPLPLISKKGAVHINASMERKCALFPFPSRLEK